MTLFNLFKIFYSSLELYDFFLFIFYYTCSSSNLRLRNNGLNLRHLDVVLVEVALEVEVGQALRVRNAQQLLERGIRLDVVLVLEALLLDVGRHRLGDVGAAHLAALRLAEEDAEVIAQLRGDLEDAEAGRLRRTVLIELRRRAALALAGILDLAGNTLLELLELGVQRGDRLAEAVQGTDHATDLIADRLDRLLSGLGRHRRNNGRHSRNNRGSRNGLRLGRRLLGNNLLGLNRRRGRNGNRGRHRRDLNRLLLGNTLRRNLGNSGGGVHCTSTGGRIGRHFTHYDFFHESSRSNFYIRIYFFPYFCLWNQKIIFFF